MRALRIKLRQSSANYRREETVDNKMTYPLPPYSTVIGALHKACGSTEYMPMQLSIQGDYGGMRREVYLDHCILNSLQNDRGILVKMSNDDTISKGYIKVATAKKSQGNDFRKGITIDVIHPEYLQEYRDLKNLNDEISEFKKKRFQPLLKKIKERKNTLAQLKKSTDISPERLKRVLEREADIKQLEKDAKGRLEDYEREYYRKPISLFRTLTTAPKYYEVLFDIELIIHVVAADEVLECIYDNIDNLTSIGRSEDFVDVEECEFTELSEIDDDYYCKYHAYIPADAIEADGMFANEREGIKAHGTKYLLNKNYELSPDGKKRIFNKKLVSYISEFSVFDCIDNVYIDKGEENYIVGLV